MTAFIVRMTDDNMAPKMRGRFLMACDFCGQTESEADVLIESRSGRHICGECVDTCAITIAEHRRHAREDDEAAP